MARLLEKQDVIDMATSAGWKLVRDDLRARTMIFHRQNGDIGQIDYYLVTGTVKTSIRHPTLGNTQLFRHKVHKDLLQQIFHNPRVHTPVGYQRKHGIGYARSSINRGERGKAKQ